LINTPPVTDGENGQELKTFIDADEEHGENEQSRWKSFKTQFKK
jgi:hypothetical protein